VATIMDVAALKAACKATSEARDEDEMARNIAVLLHVLDPMRHLSPLTGQPAVLLHKGLRPDVAGFAAWLAKANTDLATVKFAPATDGSSGAPFRARRLHF